MPCNCRHLGNTHEHITRSGNGSPSNAAQHISLNTYLELERSTFFNIQQNRVDACKAIDPQVLSSSTSSTSGGASLPTMNEVAILSDSDEEILMTVYFRDFVRIKGINIVGPGDSQSPSLVKLFTNRNEVTGFDAVRRLVPDQQLQLANTPEVNDLLYLVDAHKFGNVSNLTLLFDSNYGADETALCRIEFFGETTGRQVDKQIASNLVFEARANPADHPELMEEDKKRFAPVM